MGDGISARGKAANNDIIVTPHPNGIPDFKGSGSSLTGPAALGLVTTAGDAAAIVDASTGNNADAQSYEGGGGLLGLAGAQVISGLYASKAASGNLSVTVGAAAPAAQPATDDPNGDIVVTAPHGPKWYAQQDAVQAQKHGFGYNFFDALGFHKGGLIYNAFNSAENAAGYVYQTVRHDAGAVYHAFVNQVRSNENPWVTPTYQPNPNGRLYGFVASGSYNPNTLEPIDYMDANGGIHIAPKVNISPSYIAQVNAAETNSIQGAQFRDTFEKGYVTSYALGAAVVAPEIVTGYVARTGITGTGAIVITQGLNAGYTVANGAATNLAKGDPITTGSLLGDAGTGFLVPMEFKGLPGGSIVAGGLHGAVMGGFSKGVEQEVNTGSLNFSEVRQQALTAGATEAITGSLAPGSYVKSPYVSPTPILGAGR